MSMILPVAVLVEDGGAGLGVGLCIFWLLAVVPSRDFCRSCRANSGCLLAYAKTDKPLLALIPSMVTPPLFFYKIGCYRQFVKGLL
jgi:hypothetical protein